MTWSEAVDEALCVGWIDSVRYSVDAERSRQRFTPRRKGSNWSAINVAKVAAADGRGPDAAGRAGGVRAAVRGEVGRLLVRATATMAAFSPARGGGRSGPNAAAWAWFESRPPSFRTAGDLVGRQRQAGRDPRSGGSRTLVAESAAGRTAEAR